MNVVATVRDTRDAPRGGLAAALEQLARSAPATLVVAELACVGRSLEELVALLDWLRAVEADLIALDVDLDTATAAGRRTVRTLREVQRWHGLRIPGRPPRGRPGLAALTPELGERIEGLRHEQGLSLQAIADLLNAEGMPTPRGGSRWRPSSVQSALGYRRPRPGAPPLPPLPRQHPRPRPPARKPPPPPRGGPRPPTGP